MTTNAEQAARLLRNAAKFFRHVGEQTPALKSQMETSARNYDHTASLVETDAEAKFVPVD